MPLPFSYYPITISNGNRLGNRFRAVVAAVPGNRSMPRRLARSASSEADAMRAAALTQPGGADERPHGRPACLLA